MNTKAIYAACLFAALNICTLSARAEAEVTPTTYSYSRHLYIKEVVSMTQDVNPSCGIINAQMVYLDSQNETQILDYTKFSDSCDNGS